MTPTWTLKELRVARELSRAKVAADLGISERHLYRLESDRSPLKRMHLVAFADYYGVEPGQIVSSVVAA